MFNAEQLPFCTFKIHIIILKQSSEPLNGPGATGVRCQIKGRIATAAPAALPVFSSLRARRAGASPAGSGWSEAPHRGGSQGRRRDVARRARRRRRRAGLGDRVKKVGHARRPRGSARREEATRCTMATSQKVTEPRARPALRRMRRRVQPARTPRSLAFAQKWIRRMLGRPGNGRRSIRAHLYNKYQRQPRNRAAQTLPVLTAPARS